MSSIALEILLIIILIVANGVFSGSEIAIVSARKVRLEQLAEGGNRKARVALKLANTPNDFLSTVQIGITLIGILSGAVGGATLAQRLKPLFEQVPTLQPYSEGISVAIIVTIITYLSLVIGELVPKRIALNAPEQISLLIASPMRFLSRLTTPLVKILGVSTDTLLNLLGVKNSEEPDITEEEIKILIRQGSELGMFDESEHEMVERVFRLGERPIKAMMTPRTEVIWLDILSSLEENLQTVIKYNYSRFPVGRGSLDKCIGFVRIHKLLIAQLSGQKTRLEDFIQQPLYVPETTKTLNVIEQFKETGVHIALVIDEYGGIEGLVTLNDLMEAIVGDLPSFENEDEPLIIQREDGSWLLDGSLDIDDFKNLFDKDSLPQEDSNIYHTLAGLIIHVLGHIPQSGEYFEWDGLRLEIVDMDSTRIDKVLVTKLVSEIIETNDEM